ncbi:MAG: hypothetical protein KGL39_40285 [Patescibacteria group bacterium]|nr:hypothetical protein [Patescibacteria group bacterium]
MAENLFRQVCLCGNPAVGSHMVNLNKPPIFYCAHHVPPRIRWFNGLANTALARGMAKRLARERLAAQVS